MRTTSPLFKPIFLIGMMGCGKSATGKQLAQLLGWPFIDLDRLIEDESGLSVPEIFSRYGEEKFRLLEREALQKTLAIEEPIVVATGGGTPCFFDNILKMKEKGWVVYIRTPIDLLMERLAKDVSERPLFYSESREKILTELMQKRKEYYEQAHIVYEQKREGMKIAEELFGLVKSEG
jgi:shikimate kinase